MSSGQTDANTIKVIYNNINGTSTDCGASRYAKDLKMTEGLIKKKGDMPQFNSELVNMAGPFCDRLVFSIGPDGKAMDATFAVNSPDRILDRAAWIALKGYLFYAPKQGEKSKFMLIFHSYAFDPKE